MFGPRRGYCSPSDVKASAGSISVERAQQLARLRTALRDFLWRTESVAKESGLTPTQYLLLLLIKGAPDGAERRRFVDLATDLRSSRNTVSELVHRAERAGLIRREPSEDDQRVVYLRVTREGEQRLARAVDASERDRVALAQAFSALLSAYAEPPAR
jgi:DNA-binding MarR family transcriptional regulator